jgi:GT2 family glycosyltransferase
MDKVIIATCSAGEVEADYVQALWALTKYEYNRGRKVSELDYITAVGGPRLGFHRNKVVKRFLEHTDADWLLFIDSDMVFPPDALERLLGLADESSARVLAGLCFSGGYGGDIRPTLYNVTEDEKHAQFILDWEIDSVIQVDITGAAFLMIHANLLSEMYELHGENWFTEMSRFDQVCGEDWSFCLRVKDMNEPLLVDTSIKVGHIKKTVIDSFTFIDQMKAYEKLGKQPYEGIQEARR